MELKDGLHFDVKFEDYLHWPIFSQSVVKQGQQSAAHVKAAFDGERVMIPTDAMILGTAMHTTFLEPDEAAERIRVWDGGARRGKEWEAYKLRNADKIILTESQGEKLSGMVASLRRHPAVRKWQEQISGVEVSCIGKAFGLRMKGRCDGLTPDPMIDLKKVASGDPRKVTMACLSFGYDIQAAIYRELFNRDRFILFTVEDKPPFDVCPYEFSAGFLRRGEAEAKRLIAKVIECEQSGIWLGRSVDPVQLECPEWAENSSVDFGGTDLFGD